MKNHSLFWLCLIATLTSLAQNTVTIDATTKRYIGGVTELDRTKYFRIHSTGSDVKYDALNSAYHVIPGHGLGPPFRTLAAKPIKQNISNTKIL